MGRRGDRQRKEEKEREVQEERAAGDERRKAGGTPPPTPWRGDHKRTPGVLAISRSCLLGVCNVTPSVLG